MHLRDVLPQIQEYATKKNGSKTMNWAEEIILITGASSGLGKALAHKAGSLKATTTLISRNEEQLQEVKYTVEKNGGKAFTFIYDLHDVQTIGDLYKDIKEQVGAAPTVLINNAGYNATGFVMDTPVSAYMNNFNVNFFSPIAMIQAVLPDMVKKGGGTIVNILGAANYHSFPGASSYCASKVALAAMHESLQAELAGLPIRTLSVNPGGVKTNYGRNRQVHGALQRHDFGVHGGEDPMVVATRILNAIAQGKKEINLCSGLDKIGPHLAYWFPKLVDKLLINRNKGLIEKRRESGK